MATDPWLASKLPPGFLDGKRWFVYLRGGAKVSLKHAEAMELLQNIEDGGYKMSANSHEIMPSKYWSGDDYHGELVHIVLKAVDCVCTERPQLP